VDPVEAQVGRARQLELLRLCIDDRRPPLLVEAEADRLAVLRKREEDDLADAELQPPAHVHLVRPRQLRRDRADLSLGHHVTEILRSCGASPKERLEEAPRLRLRGASSRGAPIL